MAAATISQERFAALVNERLMDTHEVREALGLRNPQSVYDRVARGELPPPIVKRERAFAFWDRLDIEPLTRR